MVEKTCLKQRGTRFCLYMDHAKTKVNYYKLKARALFNFNAMKFIERTDVNIVANKGNHVTSFLQ